MPRSSLFPALASLLVCFRSAVSQGSWPEPEPCGGNCTYIHDPSVIRRSDGTWFRFSTNGNIAIATAPALIGPWDYQGAMLPDGSKIDVVENQEIWAPDVFFANNKFFAYYSVSIIGLQTSDIGVATSDSGEAGSWTDHGSVGIPENLGENGGSSYNRIDGNLFLECPTCQPYFSFGSAWDDIYQTTLNDDYLTWNGETPQNMIYNSTAPAGATSPAITEGSFMFWWMIGAQKYYYYFFSSGTCCNAADSLSSPGDEYKVMVCRSESVTGEFKDQTGRDCLTEDGGTLVLGSHGNVYAPGGQGVIHDPTVDRVALYYHYVNMTLPREARYEYENFQFGFNYLDFTSGWPVVVA